MPLRTDYLKYSFFCVSLAVALPLTGVAQAPAALLAAPAAYVRTNPGSRVLALRHGQWFDGRRFRPRTFYVVNGLLQRRRPIHPDSVMDLAGQWVVPAFGDAHNHALDQVGRLAISGQGLNHQGRVCRSLDTAAFEAGVTGLVSAGLAVVAGF